MLIDYVVSLFVNRIRCETGGTSPVLIQFDSDLTFPVLGSILSGNNWVIVYLTASIIITTTVFMNRNRYSNIVSNVKTYTYTSWISNMYSMTLNQSNFQYIVIITIPIFLMVLVTNLIGSLPYVYVLYSSMIGCLSLSSIIFLACLIISVYTKKIEFFKIFVPSGTPSWRLIPISLIELVSYFFRAISLGVRLFANIVAGHILLAIIGSRRRSVLLSPWYLKLGLILIIPSFTVLYILELCVGIIQAYVLVRLTTIYMAEALSKEGH